MKINGMLLFVALVFAGAVTGLAQTAPPNDNFVNRTVLTGTDITFSGTLAGATLENSAEATNFNISGADGPATHSVWWTWTAPTTTVLTLQAVSESPNRLDYQAQIDIYQTTNANPTLNEVIYPPIGYLRFLFHFLPQTISIPVTAGNTYQFQVVGNTSDSYTFRLVATNTPVIVQQAKSQIVSSNTSALFYVVAAGLNQTNLSFQWQFNGTNLSTENAPMLALTNIDSTYAGAYTVVVSNAVGYTISEPAILTVSTSNVPASLAVVGGQGVAFSLSGGNGRTYRLQSSADLVTWQSERAFPPGLGYGVDTSLALTSNSPTPLVVTQDLPTKFYRAIPYVTADADAEICINNLRKITIAKQLFQRDFLMLYVGYSPVDADIQPYLPHQTLPICPDDTNNWFDTSYAPYTLQDLPVCKIRVVPHILELAP